jgi:hypothetical protein
MTTVCDSAYNSRTLRAALRTLAPRRVTGLAYRSWGSVAKTERICYSGRAAGIMVSEVLS